jgi:hypothetical protein
MFASIAEVVGVPARIMDEYLTGYERERQLQIRETCAEIDRLYRLYKGVLFQSNFVEKSLQKVVDYSIDDGCPIPILKKKDLRINIPVLCTTR